MRNRRWSSPKFLVGESDGTPRAAALSDDLQDRDGLYLNGMVLVCSIMNFATAWFTQGNDLPGTLALPTYPAGACITKSSAAPGRRPICARRSRRRRSLCRTGSRRR